MKNILELKIQQNRVVAPGVFLLEVEKTEQVSDINAGQFFNLKCGEGLHPLLRRPISVSLVTENTIQFIIFIKGQGTELLSKFKNGQILNLMGPFGNGYKLQEDGGKHLVIAGGIGVAPQRELVKQIAQRNPQKLVAHIGFKSTPYALETYKTYCNEIAIATEDGSCGNKGYVTTHLEESLKNEKWDTIYACGPHAMLKAIAKLCNEKNIPVQLLMEERMACGIGACLVCTCKVKSHNKEGYENVRTCKEGPVFFGAEVVLND